MDMDFAGQYRLKRRTFSPAGSVDSEEKTESLDETVAEMVSELMNAGTSFHKLHLRISGSGAYAAHKALNELYDAMPGHADDLAEGFQGRSEKLLVYEENPPKVLNSVEEALSYLRELDMGICDLQSKMPYSEIVNELDNVKSTLNSGKYKLLFLK